MRTIEWDHGVVKMIDQRLLPHRFEIAAFTKYRHVARAITEMCIRGAPAIGAAAGFGLALAAQESTATDGSQLLDDLRDAADVFLAARPTAVNLRWATERMLANAEALATGQVHTMRAERTARGHDTPTTNCGERDRDTHEVGGVHSYLLDRFVI